MNAKAQVRAAAAAARAADERRRRRNHRILAIAGAVAGVVVLGLVALGVHGAVTASAASPGSTTEADPAMRAAADGRTSAPPWTAPGDVEGAVRSAGLSMLTDEGQALHIHQHLSITVDGRAITVPALLGIDEAAQRISALHTHDTSGILHVESPVVTTFHLDQVFAEWDVRLAPGAVGPYVDGNDGVREAVFVDGARYDGDPRRIALKGHEDIDLVVTTNGSTPKAPAAFAWPSGY